MMTSSRSHGEVATNSTGRRGHSNQLSISNSGHHITEAIGTLYDEDNDSGSEGIRPLSFVPGLPHQEQILPQKSQQDGALKPTPCPNSIHLGTNEMQASARGPQNDNGNSQKMQALNLSTTGSRVSSPKDTQSPSSPNPSLREAHADPSFPLTTIGNPSDIAQELSNLQALRRLSMDVGNSIDPDMPLMPLTSIPSIAPRGDDDENDPLRLLWVPASVHPELAPTEFKSFLENRLQSIRRRSGDSFLIGNDETGKSDLGIPNVSLRRKKSMLSRQIDNSGGRGAVGYVDGAERLERQRSRGSPRKTELSLDDLVRDPTSVVQKLAQESQGFSGGLESSADDLPILPVAPGAGLRRSTRTTYRKGGSLRSGDKTSFPKRVAQRQPDEYSEQIGSRGLDNSHGQGRSVSIIQPEPVVDSHSKPQRSVRRQQKFLQDTSIASSVLDDSVHGLQESHKVSEQLHQRQVSASSSSPRQDTSSSDHTGMAESKEIHDQSYSKSSSHRSALSGTGYRLDNHSESFDDGHLDRSISHLKGKNHSEGQPHQQHVSKSSISTQAQVLDSTSTTFLSSLPKGNTGHTDSLTFTPILASEEKKSDKRAKKERDEESFGHSSKPSGAWKWFKGGMDDKDKKKEEIKKSRSRASSERAQDNVRLDLIQTSIEKTATKGRESFVSDRDGVDNRLLEESKRENNRRVESKKDKDGSIFSSIFGGKKKEDKEKTKRNQHLLQVPEDPPYKPLKPDVDYNWSRFPLLEERAIYRMAHIKLANPRRSLHSQVLLSNFMYSYLAIVQAMHPQMNVPMSPQQRRLEEESQRKQQEQYLAQQQTMEEADAQQTFDQYNYDYHRMAVQYSNSGGDGHVDYVDEAQIFEDEHENQNYDDSPDGYGQDIKGYLQYQNDNQTGSHNNNQDHMW